MDFLSEFAKEKSNNINFNGYAKCAHKIGVINDQDLLLKEIIDSGLVVGEVSRLEFIHPTANEFFHARWISNLSSEKAMGFIKETHNREEYFETILFLVGLLRDQGKQDQILDFLEENNLELFIKCITARYHIDLSSPLNYQDVERRYLSQLQKTYNVLLNKYFDKIKFRFAPYRFMEIDPSVLKESKVRVRGSLDVSNSRIFYEYLPTTTEDKEMEPEIVKSTPGILSGFIKIGNAPAEPIIASSSGGQFFYKNLNLTRLGLDSAREVAVKDIMDRLNELIDKQLLIMPPILACERVVEEIHTASSTAKMFQDKELKSIWKFEDGVYEAQEYLQAFEGIKDYPFVAVGTRQIPLRIYDIIIVLKYLMANSISIPNSVLPQFNPYNESSGNCPAPSTRYGLYDPKEIKIRLEKLYSLLPRMYCEIVDLNFPNMRQYLGHCRIYPFKYIIYFSVDGGLSHEDYWISRIYHLPVASEEEINASVDQIKSENIGDEDDLDTLHEYYIKMLKTVGRYSDANRDEFFIGSSGFNDVINDKPITKLIYKLLKDDFKDLFQKG